MLSSQDAPPSGLRGKVESDGGEGLTLLSDLILWHTQTLYIYILFSECVCTQHVIQQRVGPSLDIQLRSASSWNFQSDFNCFSLLGNWNFLIPCDLLSNLYFSLKENKKKRIKKSVASCSNSPCVASFMKVTLLCTRLRYYITNGCFYFFDKKKKRGKKDGLAAGQHPTWASPLVESTSRRQYLAQ